MSRLGEAALAVALLLGIFQSGCSVHFSVTEAGKICIQADLSINFTVEYKNGDKQDVAKFPLPENAVSDKNSSCGKENGTVPLLVIVFGSNHSLSISFNKSDTEYHVEKLVFTYNLSDAVFFPGSTENGTKQVSSDKTEISASTKHFYQCTSPHIIAMGAVNATFHHVKLEAYLENGNYSTEATTCKEDVSPTPAPSPTPTAAPVNPKTPDVIDYRVNDTSGAACLLAKMGLQLNVTYKTKDDKDASYRFNIEPAKIQYNGFCSKTYTTLNITFGSDFLLFNFTLNATESKFYLHLVHLNLTVLDAKDPNIDVENASLSYLQTTTHKSYKCSSKQTLQVTDKFSVDTYSLQIQPFDIDENKFGPAVECSADQNGMLVPIIVGAALAGLVLIVLIAYLIGRKRSHAGYQTI
ncbi:hypothetical protein GDO81_005437 [Engystomops pustulosus]|uniref:Lysosome-associated membrane glycoprotein 1 n=1 Tax=Engystomops pustulosus TaxID=76066 RepID=A0AAV7CNF8_ENGPU|nr:hypothetical protein GDO81_005437 [Engystomops pustulosus]